MRWRPFSHNGTLYDLGHLHPRIISYLQPAKGTRPPHCYRVEVIFSLHCFTRSMEGETPDQALLYGDDRETRIFDFERYSLSHRLPAIVGSLMTRKCFHTDKGNFLTVEIIDDQGNKVDYEIYFAASKSAKPGIVTVYLQSAYTRDTAHGKNRPQKKPISFAVILFNTLNRIPIRVPQ